MTSTAAVILFDGVCNLCNGFVQFIINHDSANRFRFTSLQSKAGQQLLAAHGLATTTTAPESVVLIENGRAYTHSTAALRILGQLGGLWAGLYAGMLVPRPLRDMVYRFIARHRYQWFGRQESCWLPTPELKARFL